MERCGTAHHVQVCRTPQFEISCLFSKLVVIYREAYCDMKIEEKGLKGKAAETRKEAMNNRGFNAFRLMGRDDSSAKQEVYLDFLGHKVRIHKDEKGNGTIEDEDVPFVRGATLRFDGCGGALSWSDIKVRASTLCYHSEYQ